MATHREVKESVRTGKPTTRLHSNMNIESMVAEKFLYWKSDYSRTDCVLTQRERKKREAQ